MSIKDVEAIKFPPAYPNMFVQPLESFLVECDKFISKTKNVEFEINFYGINIALQSSWILLILEMTHD